LVMMSLLAWHMFEISFQFLDNFLRGNELAFAHRDLVDRKSGDHFRT